MFTAKTHWRLDSRFISPRACLAFSALETARIFRSLLRRFLYALDGKFGIASSQRGPQSARYLLSSIQQRELQSIGPVTTACTEDGESRSFLNQRPRVRLTPGPPSLIKVSRLINQPGIPHPTVIESARCLAPASQCLPDSRLTIGLRAARRRFFR